MKINILHLSDIHIKEDSKDAINEINKIKTIIAEKFNKDDMNYIAITGDLAYSGKESEYIIVESMINELKLHIEKFGIEAKVLLVPGNHDCELSNKSTIRDLIIDSLKDDEEKAHDEEIISECTKPQENFFNLRKKYENYKTILSDNLWQEVIEEHNDRKISFSLINASWTSRLNEKQGELVFPIKKYQEIYKQDCDLRVALIHHPLNWYNQESYHKIRKAITENFHIVLSGHEHTQYGTESITDNGSLLHLECASLIPHTNEDEQGFTILNIDLNNSKIEITKFRKENNEYKAGKITTHNPQFIRKSQKPTVKDIFMETIEDPGVFITHPSSKKISFSDIIIDIDLERNEEQDYIKLSEIEIKDSKSIIKGKDDSGKTKALHTIFKRALKEGLFPIYIDAKKIRRTTEAELIKQIEKQEVAQYENCEKLKTIPKNEKVILIDNFEEINLIQKGAEKIISYIEKNYSSIFITCDNTVDTNILGSIENSEETNKYSSLAIRDFGSNARNKLIKKWHEIESATDQKGKDLKVFSTESIINSVLGKNLIPSRPLYLLTLLQSTSTQEKEELHNSGMSYYYQYLITKNLEDAGVGRSSLDENFNYFSNLAWFLTINESETFDSIDIEKFNSDFSKKFTTTSSQKKLDILKKSRIISDDDGYFSFSHPYIKYFFLGKYLADNLENEEVKEKIEEICSDLSSRENSNTILFLTHHRNTKNIIEKISKKLDECFNEHQELDLEKDSISLNKKIEHISDIVISEINVEKNQENNRDIRDKESYEPDEDEIKKNEKLIELFNLIRSSEVLGQIIKNYYGSISREDKKNYLKSIIGSKMRLANFVLESILDGSEKLTNKIEQEIKKTKNTINQNEAERIAKSIISEFIKTICFGIIMNTSESINSEKLFEDIDSLSEEIGTNSYQLIKAASYLMTPHKIPFEKIKKISRKVEKNNLALSVLQQISIYHIYMFNTPDQEKQKLGSMVKVSLSGINSLLIEKK